MIKIREIIPDDAGQLLRLMQELDREAEYLLYEQGERPMDGDALRDHIRKLDPPRFGTFFVAETVRSVHPDKPSTRPETDPGSEFAGYLEVRRLPWKRVQHRAYLVIGILKRYAGKGVGTRLMQEVESWAMEHGIRRLYLTLIAENKPAVALYRKMGYETEGRHPASMRLGERYVDELTMGKWLG